MLVETEGKESVCYVEQSLLLKKIGKWYNHWQKVLISKSQSWFVNNLSSVLIWLLKPEIPISSYWILSSFHFPLLLEFCTVFGLSVLANLSVAGDSLTWMVNSFVCVCMSVCVYTNPPNSLSVISKFKKNIKKWSWDRFLRRKIVSPFSKVCCWKVCINKIHPGQIPQW